MTLHVNELNIQMRVRDEKAEADVQDDVAAREPAVLSDERMEEIVALAVRRTLAALRALKAR